MFFSPAESFFKKKKQKKLKKLSSTFFPYFSGDENEKAWKVTRTMNKMKTN
jgi:hypothetical protein